VAPPGRAASIAASAIVSGSVGTIGLGDLMTLLVTGGQQRRPRALGDGAEHWYKYVRGHVLEIDESTEQVSVVHSYESPPSLVADEEPAVLFKQGTLVGGTLYLATQTEILVYTYPGFEVVHHISLPSFHDVHHVRPRENGTLLVVNTGLDQLIEITTEGEVVNRWHVLGNDPWSRFSPDVDYRKVASTKPYDSHPNHVFELGDEIWITRFKQMDAVSIKDPSRRIDVGVGRVHDGFVRDGLVYFTAVNGIIAVADTDTLHVVEVVDLNRIGDERTQLGWCRGIHVDDDGVWVGFSRLRPTAIRENVAWVKGGFKKSLGTHVARYDLESRSLLQRISVEDHDLNAVFSIFRV